MTQREVKDSRTGRRTAGVKGVEDAETKRDFRWNKDMKRNVESIERKMLSKKKKKWKEMQRQMGILEEKKVRSR